MNGHTSRRHPQHRKLDPRVSSLKLPDTPQDIADQHDQQQQQLLPVNPTASPENKAPQGQVGDHPLPSDAARWESDAEYWKWFMSDLVFAVAASGVYWSLLLFMKSQDHPACA